MQKFWQAFALSNWEKKPKLAKDFRSPVQEIDDIQIFSMLVDYSNYCRKQGTPEGFKLFVNGQRQYDEDVLQILPLKKDKSLVGFHQRMEVLFSDYCLVCDKLLQTSDRNWKQLQDFNDNLFQHVGIPNRFVEMGLYLGNYRQTPFGVHVDGCGVFSFPVVGKKVFRLWKPEFAKKHPKLDRAHNYSAFKKDSVVLVAEPGDMTYWPSGAWHIAESDGSFNVTWSLGIWVDRPQHEVLQQALQPLLKLKLGPLGDTTMAPYSAPELDGEILDLPQTHLDSVSILKKLTTEDFQDALMKNWVAHISNRGFKDFPIPRSEQTATLKSKIRLKEAHQVQWARLKSDQNVVYGFAGMHWQSSSTQLRKIIQKLNLGHDCVVGQHLKGPLRKTDLRIIQALADAGAFEKF